jgi:hypothetical protein
MTSINVTPLEPGWYGVEAEEGDVRSGHRVEVPDTFLDRTGLDDGDASSVARATIEFLLERVTLASIPPELSVNDVASVHEDLTEEVFLRVAS